jgi:hypothetical protein
MDPAPTTRPSLLIRRQDPADERSWAEFVDVYDLPVAGGQLWKGFHNCPFAAGRPQAGRAGKRQGATSKLAHVNQPGNDGSKPGMRVPRSIETRNKIHACIALGWNETKKKTVLRLRLEETRQRRHCWWRSPAGRNWR